MLKHDIGFNNNQPKCMHAWYQQPAISHLHCHLFCHLLYLKMITLWKMKVREISKSPNDSSVVYNVFQTGSFIYLHLLASAIFEDLANIRASSARDKGKRNLGNFIP